MIKRKRVTPFAKADAYKLSHWGQYPEDIMYVFGNWTPRYSMRSGIDKFVFFGLQAFLMTLNDTFERDFFGVSEVEAASDYMTFYRRFFNQEPLPENIERVRALHRLGYLPIQILALPEGSILDHNVPPFVIYNTVPGYHWLAQWIETWMSCEVWKPSTSATTSLYYRSRFDAYAAKTSDIGFLSAFQGHGFEMRGMSGIDDAEACAAGHCLFSQGTDTCVVLDFVDTFYDGEDNGMIATSVPATEHSVASCGILTHEIKDKVQAEIAVVKRFCKMYPTGVLSYVSDTFDFWAFVTEVLPACREDIMARDGTFVPRPDSGDPVKILCGDSESTVTCVRQGLIECLAGIFGATPNSKGYLQLDSHISAIYGDSITLDRQAEILFQLEMKGFASTNLVLGIGSYTYQFVTRDTHGQAMKATACAKADGVWLPLFKDPKTDTSGKKSARGLLAVYYSDGKYTLMQDMEMSQVWACAFQDTYTDGRINRHQTYGQIRAHAAAQREAVGL